MESIVKFPKTLMNEILKYLSRNTRNDKIRFRF